VNVFDAHRLLAAAPQPCQCLDLRGVLQFTPVEPRLRVMNGVRPDFPGWPLMNARAFATLFSAALLIVAASATLADAEGARRFQCADEVTGVPSEALIEISPGGLYTEGPGVAGWIRNQFAAYTFNGRLFGGRRGIHIIGRSRHGRAARPGMDRREPGRPHAAHRGRCDPCVSVPGIAPAPQPPTAFSDDSKPSTSAAA
jgi:hypothetical protein